MNSMQSGYDWEKNKNYQVKKRGNLSLLATTTFRNGDLVSGQARCIWPSSLLGAESKIITRRMWSKIS